MLRTKIERFAEAEVNGNSEMSKFDCEVTLLHVRKESPLSLLLPLVQLFYRFLLLVLLLRTLGEQRNQLLVEARDLAVNQKKDGARFDLLAHVAALSCRSLRPILRLELVRPHV